MKSDSQKSLEELIGWTAVYLALSMVVVFVLYPSISSMFFAGTNILLIGVLAHNYSNLVGERKK